MFEVLYRKGMEVSSAQSSPFIIVKVRCWDMWLGVGICRYTTNQNTFILWLFLFSVTPFDSEAIEPLFCSLCFFRPHFSCCPLFSAFLSLLYVILPLLTSLFFLIYSPLTFFSYSFIAYSFFSSFFFSLFVYFFFYFSFLTFLHCLEFEIRNDVR